jgi:hypothetical protein
MAAEIKQEIALEIAHVLFIDIVAYSKMASDDQRAAIQELNVRTSPVSFSYPRQSAMAG